MIFRSNIDAFGGFLPWYQCGHWVLVHPTIHSSPLQINGENLVTRDQIVKSVAGGEQ